MSILQAWINGRLYAPFHRVTMTGNVVRYSFGTFTGFKTGYLIKAPEELVDEETEELVNEVTDDGEERVTNELV